MNNAIIHLFKFASHLQHSRNIHRYSNKLTNIPMTFLSMSSTADSLNKSTTVFQGIQDRFNGITIDSKEENFTLETFANKLEESLKTWNDANKRGIWFKIALEHCEFIPLLAKKGFDFHHAKSGYVMLNKWLPKHEPSRIPLFAHTMLAVGALVMNDKSEVLAVQEKHFLISHWKFPGGVVEPGENLVEAAIREVKEETNIDFEFKSVISFIHADKAVYGCSDMYVIVAGKALNTDIKICEREIAKGAWININEYCNKENVTEFNKALVKHYTEYQDRGIKIDFVQGLHKLSQRSYTMYSVNFKDE